MPKLCRYCTAIPTPIPLGTYLMMSLENIFSVCLFLSEFESDSHGLRTPGISDSHDLCTLLAENRAIYIFSRTIEALNCKSSSPLASSYRLVHPNRYPSLGQKRVHYGKIKEKV